MKLRRLDNLKMEYDAALAKLRQSTEAFDRLITPTRAQLRRLEQDRVVFEQARTALEKHLKRHAPPSDSL